MKTRTVFFWILVPTLLGALLLGAAPAKAAGEVDVGFFYENLAPYGHWVTVEPYGWVWYPTGVQAGWRPYTDGHWAWTDDYGWTWVAAEEWGWAPFHYGRWDFRDDLGWYWIPDTVWGPAWVAWRHGGGYVGWAPLPPQARYSVGIGLEWGGVDVDIVVRRPAWVFVDERRIMEPRLREVVVRPDRNVTIIHNTTTITNITVNQNRIVNNGIPIARVEEVTRQKVPHVRVSEAGNPADARPRTDTRDQIHLYRPAVRPAAVGIRPPEKSKPAPGEQPRVNPQAPVKPDSSGPAKAAPVAHRWETTTFKTPRKVPSGPRGSPPAARPGAGPAQACAWLPRTAKPLDGASAARQKPPPRPAIYPYPDSSFWGMLHPSKGSLAGWPVVMGDARARSVLTDAV